MWEVFKRNPQESTKKLYFEFIYTALQTSEVHCSGPLFANCAYTIATKSLTRNQNVKTNFMSQDFRFRFYYSYALFTTILPLTVLHQLHQLKREKKYTIHSQNKMCSVTKVA